MFQSTTLNLQLENLEILFEEAVLNGNSLSEVKRLYDQIKKKEKLILEIKAKMN